VIGEPGRHTRAEILSQPGAWQTSLRVVEAASAEQRALWSDARPDAVVFTGCGSTHYLAVSAAAVVAQLTGVPARGVPASELILYPETVLPARGRVLLVAVSRSGETTETLEGVRAFRAAGRGEIVTLSCYPDRPLARLGAANLVFPEAQEESVAQTRAFTSLYLACLALAATWAGRDDVRGALAVAPVAGSRLLESGLALPRRLGRDLSIDRVYLLGSGARYGLACELSLKLKEMSLTHSEPFHFLEFRHGPKSMVTPSTLVVGLLSESGRSAEEDVLAELRALGARALTIGTPDADVALPPELAEPASIVLSLLPGQWLAFERALAKGLDPDRPTHLDAVVRLERVRD